MYATVAQVRLALAPGIASPENQPNTLTHTAADLPNSQIEDAIAEADAQIDAMIGKFYIVPVQPVGGPTPVIPHPLDYWCRNIAAYNATLTNRKGLDLTDNDPVVRRWRMAMDALTLVATGKATLSLPPNRGDSGVSGAGDVFNPYSGTLFPAGDFGLGYGSPMERAHWHDGYSSAYGAELL